MVPTRRALALHAAVLMLPAGADVVHAQRVIEPAVRPQAASESPFLPAGESVGESASALRVPPRRAPRWAPIASLVVPGSGQLAMRQTRGAAYIAAELYAVLVYREYSRDARDRRAEYKRTARLVAREPFGGRRDTSAWSYYESVLDYPASGQYNLTPGGSLTPETDVTTYNGKVWLDARSLYWRDPEQPPPTTDPSYQRAIDLYTTRAVQGEFMWTWINRGLEQQVYAGAIARENLVTRYRTTVLNVLIVNHILSAIDALTSLRVRESVGPDGARRYEAHLPWAPFGRGRRDR